MEHHMNHNANTYGLGILRIGAVTIWVRGLDKKDVWTYWKYHKRCGSSGNPVKHILWVPRAANILKYNRLVTNSTEHWLCSTVQHDKCQTGEKSAFILLIVLLAPNQISFQNENLKTFLTSNAHQPKCHINHELVGQISKPQKCQLEGHEVEH